MYIPTTVKVEQVVNRLVGKWFGNLRWIGLIEGDGGYILQWANTDKYQVNLKIISRYAIIESNAVGEKNKADAMMSAYRILEQITKTLKTETDKSYRKSLDPFNQYN